MNSSRICSAQLRDGCFYKDSKDLRETTFTKLFKGIEAVVWGIFVIEGISKVSCKYRKKSLYERTRFEPLDTCANELYLLANTVKFVFHTSIAFGGGSTLLKIASSVADLGFFIVYGSWMLDAGSQGYFDKRNYENSQGSQDFHKEFYQSRSIEVFGTFSSHFSYMVYCGINFILWGLHVPELVMLSRVSLVYFVFFNFVSDWSQTASQYMKECEILVLKDEVDKESLHL